MDSIDKMATDGTYDNISKKERLQIQRQREKLEKNLGSVADLKRLPAAIFVVDILKEKIAVTEAQRLNIPIFAMVDTNSDPTCVDFAIPANDDSSKSISLIVGIMTKAIIEGLEERKNEKPAQEESEKENAGEGIGENETQPEEVKVQSSADKKDEQEAGNKKGGKTVAKRKVVKTGGKRKRTTVKKSSTEDVKAKAPE
jgi:small subunit ribosomal protein S2